ncbi:MAG: hypothetical protein ACYCVD_10895 [Desulfitobacteriaceae bacterium]
MENTEFQELMLEHFGKVLAKLETVDSRLTGVEMEIASVKGELTSVKGEIASVKGELTSVKGELISVKGEIASVKQNQVRMENELGEKITALFDGYSLRGDQIAKMKAHFDKRLDTLSEDVNFLVKKAFRHDEAIQELRKIR